MDTRNAGGVTNTLPASWGRNRISDGIDGEKGSDRGRIDPLEGRGNMDFLIGGVAGAGASFFTNPMDVIKTRLQLQGELKAPDSYRVRYRGFLHAIYVITKMDGITALQSGLTPALLLGFSLNFVRLGLYRKAERLGWTTDDNGRTSIGKSAFLASISGGLSGITATPSFVVKTRMQVSANPNIAVGRQHKYKNTLDAFSQIFKKDGVKGFYVGLNATCTRLAVGSAVQMSSFSTVKEMLLHAHHEHFVNSNALLAFSASSVSGMLVAIVMCPMDVITTRLYNQGNTGPNGKYTKYDGMMDCLKKSLHKEGIFGLYKGIGPFYLRIAPHTTLTLVLWDVLNDHFY